MHGVVECESVVHVLIDLIFGWDYIFIKSCKVICATV